MESGEREKYEYEYDFEKRKKVDDRIRGLMGIYYKHKRRPTYRIAIKEELIDSFEIWTLIQKIKGHKTFNKWINNFIETEIKKLAQKEDPEYLLALATFKDLKVRVYKNKK
jgi:hypothetical protein